MKKTLLNLYGALSIPLIKPSTYFGFMYILCLKGIQLDKKYVRLTHCVTDKMNEIYHILIKLSMKFDPVALIDKRSPLVKFIHS